MNEIRFGLGGLALVACLGCAHPQKAPQEENTTAFAPMAVPPAPACEGLTCAPPVSCAGEVKQTVRQSALHFDFDSDRLSPLSEQYLTGLAQTLRQCPAAKVEIEGNCDERGTEEYNLALGQRRAEVAKHYLVQAGVSAAQLETISYGQDKPVDERHNEQAWAMNRRDDFQLEAGGPTATSP